MFAAFLLAYLNPALAGVTTVSEVYDAECSVILDGEEIPSVAIFSGWWTGDSGLRGTGDGTFSWMVAGWDPYGYQQSVQPHPPGDVTAWGWTLLLEEDPGQDLVLQTETLSCEAGTMATLEGWDRVTDLQTSPATILISDVTGEAETLSLDRLRVQDGLLEIDCSGVGWDDGTPLTITLSWLGGAS